MTSSPTFSTNSEGARGVQGLPDLAFVGKAGAGKSSAADFLVANLGYRKLSFAQPLKDIAAELWGEAARTDREKLQRLGVAVRDIDPDTWRDLLIQSVKAERPEGQPFVVDDCRFENEWFALRSEGFVTARVVAPSALRVARLKANGKLQDEAQLDHVSETAIDHLAPDYVLFNDSARYDFEDAVVRVLERERRRA